MIFILILSISQAGPVHQLLQGRCQERDEEGLQARHGGHEERAERLRHPVPGHQVRCLQRLDAGRQLRQEGGLRVLHQGARQEPRPEVLCLREHQVCR